MREWTEVAFSSIYYILRKLENESLIRSHIDQGEGKGPARKVYEIAENGLKAWYGATLESLSTPRRPSDPFLLGLAGMPAIPPDEALAALRHYQGKLTEDRDHVMERWRAAGAHLPLSLEGMFDISVSQIESRMEWVDKFISRLEEEIGR